MRKFYWIIVTLVMLALTSCRTAQWHLDKAIDKGVVITPKTVTVTDTFTIDGIDSIITVEVKSPCPEIEIPKPRWRVRFDNRRFNDSMKVMRKMYNDSLSFNLKTLREENDMKTDSLNIMRKIIEAQERTERTTVRKENKKRNWWLFWLGFSIGVAAMIALRYFWGRFKKIIFPEN